MFVVQKTHRTNNKFLATWKVAENRTFTRCSGPVVLRTKTVEQI